MNTARIIAIFLLSVWGIFSPQLAVSAPAPAESGAAFLLHSLSVVTQSAIQNSLPNSMQGSESRLEASVSVAGLPALQASLREGASFHLDADVQVDLLRSLLPNRAVSTSHDTCLIRFDPLTREYILMRQNALPARHKRLDTLFEEALGDSVHTFPLPPDHAHGDQYRASLTLSLRYADVPPWLRKTLFFWSWNIIDPMTFTLDFVPNAPELPATAK